jgi:hypothetical protein
MKKNFLIFFACSVLVFLPVFALAAEAPVAVGATADPANNILCWTNDACVSDWDNDGKPNGMWDATDINGAIKTCGGGTYGYCYAYILPYNLSVSLPLGGTGITTVQDLGDYINKLYIFLLGISGIIAILMIMVGGVQYVVAHGGSEAGEGKKRITNALTGVLLLFLANIILFTVNPQLIKLIVPQMPKARTVLFISDGTSCETLMAQDEIAYEIGTVSGEVGQCGDEDGVIQKINGDTPNPEQTCPWTACPSTSDVNPVMVCMQSTTGDDPGVCMGCGNVFDGNSSNIPVNSETCARLSAEDVMVSSSDYPEPHLSIRQKCFKTNDTSIDLTGTSCALATIDCSNITQCSDYEDIPITSRVGNDTLGFIQKGFGSDLGLQDICSEDPCGKTRGNAADYKCEFESDAAARAAVVAIGATSVVAAPVGIVVAANISDNCNSILRVTPPPSAPVEASAPQGGAAQER